MLRVDLNGARPGMKLALPVQNPRIPARTLLKVGFELTAEIIDKLRAQHVRSLWVSYPPLGFLEKYVSTQTVETQTSVVSQIADTFETLQRGAAAKLPYDTYTASIETLVEHLLTNPQAAVFLGDIDQAPDDLMRHSSAVTYLSVLLGLKLESYIVRERRHVNPSRAKEIRNLGLGAMLHDIGVTELAPEVRQRFAETGDESDPAWQEHPGVGFRMVRGKIDPSAAAVVLHHHQRMDGSGYAGADFPVMRDRAIHIYARIAAVADQFDALRHPPNLPPQPTVWALNTMLSEPMVSQFDPHVLAALVAVVPPYPPGTIIQLSDGQHAVCIDHDPDQPCRPLVQTIPDPDALAQPDAPAGPTLDLRQQSGKLMVVRAEGHDVREMNFTVPRHIAAPGAASAAWG